MSAEKQGGAEAGSSQLPRRHHHEHRICPPTPPASSPWVGKLGSSNVSARCTYLTADSSLSPSCGRQGGRLAGRQHGTHSAFGLTGTCARRPRRPCHTPQANPPATLPIRRPGQAAGQACLRKHRARGGARGVGQPPPAQLKRHRMPRVLAAAAGQGRGSGRTGDHGLKQPMCSCQTDATLSRPPALSRGEGKHPATAECLHLCRAVARHRPPRSPGKRDAAAAQQLCVAAPGPVVVRQLVQPYVRQQRRAPRLGLRGVGSRTGALLKGWPCQCRSQQLTLAAAAAVWHQQALAPPSPQFVLHTQQCAPQQARRALVTASV